ncbi:Peptidase, M19 (Membrane dipeptidase) family [Balamuthia mandrillaris]
MVVVAALTVLDLIALAGKALILLLLLCSVASLFSLYLFLSSLGQPRKRLRTWAAILLPPLFVALLLSFLTMVFPVVLDMTLNPVYGLAPHGHADRPNGAAQPSAAAQSLHSRLWIADMHSDTLLWPKRDILERHSYSHVDLPRLQEGNVALQAFTIVTKVPAGMNFESNPEPSLLKDNLLFKTIFEGWGLDAINSRPARTLFQIHNLQDAVRRSNGTLSLIRFREDLSSFIQHRQEYLQKSDDIKNKPVAAMLGIEGLHALDGNFTNVDVFFQEGVRMMGMTHFFDNDLGGSAHGVEKGGITEFGKRVFERMEELGILPDVAHASERLTEDIINLALASPKRRPVVSSHTGVRGVCDNVRNLKDEHIKGIARTGGLLSIAYFAPAVCGDDLLQSIVDSIKYVAKLVGVQHVALGSDFDGSVGTPFDTTGLIYLTDALLRDGTFSEHEIELIMGGNVRNLLLQHLPPSV